MMFCSRFALLLCQILSTIGAGTIEQTRVFGGESPVHILVTTFVIVVREIRSEFLIRRQRTAREQYDNDQLLQKSGFA